MAWAATAVGSWHLVGRCEAARARPCLCRQRRGGSHRSRYRVGAAASVVRHKFIDST